MKTIRIGETEPKVKKIPDFFFYSEQIREIEKKLKTPK